MIDFNYIPLKWDSEFFGYPVARITGPLEDKKQLNDLESLFHQQHGSLAYYSSQQPIKKDLIENSALEILLVDKKTTFSKSINATLSIHPSVQPYSFLMSKPKLIELALQSGIYSRFNVDAKIGRNKFEELYKIWINKSIDKSIAKEVLVYTFENNIAGFVTVGEKNNRGDIGIIAVDADYRGKGIGTALMQSAESWLGQHNYKTMQVITQGDNTPACKLYQHCGYSIESIEYFYHIRNR